MEVGGIKWILVFFLARVKDIYRVGGVKSLWERSGVSFRNARTLPSRKKKNKPSINNWIVARLKAEFYSAVVNSGNKSIVLAPPQPPHPAASRYLSRNPSYLPGCTVIAHNFIASTESWWKKTRRERQRRHCMIIDLCFELTRRSFFLRVLIITSSCSIWARDMFWGFFFLPLQSLSHKLFVIQIYLKVAPFNALTELLRAIFEKWMTPHFFFLFLIYIKGILKRLLIKGLRSTGGGISDPDVTPAFELVGANRGDMYRWNQRVWRVWR